MTQVNLPYLWTPIFRRKRSAYYRRGGTLKRIVGSDGKPVVPGDPGFLDAYNAIHNAYSPSSATVAVRPPKCLATLIASYKASDSWSELKEITRKDYGRILDELERQFGTKSVPAMELPHVHRIRDAFGGRTTPRKANKAVAVVSILMEHARAIGWRKDNPALRPKKLKTGDGYPTWTDEEWEAFLAHPGIARALKTAAVADAYTGMRVSDLVATLKSARRDGCIEVMPQKTEGTTKAKVWIPEHPELTKWLDAIPRNDSMTLLVREDGKPWKSDHIKHEMTAAAKLAGLRSGLSFHGLRKMLHRNLAEAGATDAQIEALVPHADPKMTRLYRAQADQKKLARAAIAKLVAAAAENETKTGTDRRQ